MSPLPRNSWRSRESPTPSGWRSSAGPTAAMPRCNRRHSSPTLYKAVVAIAPVTDLAMLKEEARRTSPTTELVADFIGSGPHIAEGSPLRHAASDQGAGAAGPRRHGCQCRASRTVGRWTSALRSAGKPVEFLTFKGLDHQLDDSDARTRDADQDRRAARPDDRPLTNEKGGPHGPPFVRSPDRD